VTVVVGVRHRAGVVLAADSATTTTWSGRQNESAAERPKAFSRNELVAVASCGSVRISQVLHYGVTVPRIDPCKDELEWAVTELIPAVRTALRDAGALHVSNGVDDLDNSSFLLAVRARLFTVYTDLQVAEYVQPWACTGSGGEVASGHLESLALGPELTPEQARDAAAAAVATAGRRNAFVGGRTTTVETSRWSKAERELARKILGA
jgi:ATP-dependent protease HslVU (ClpYQ) peptidase subunit